MLRVRNGGLRRPVRSGDRGDAGKPWTREGAEAPPPPVASRGGGLGPFCPVVTTRGGQPRLPALRPVLAAVPWWRGYGEGP